jgi:photosystem II stability/assembly factor-like uncharacterized protein
MRRPRSLGALLLAGALCASGASADAQAPSWRFERAPIFGGDIRSLAIDPRDADIVLAGTSAGQVYRSRDGGRSWSDAGAQVPLPGWVVGVLHFDVNRPGRVWAGMWGLWGGGGVAWSDDLGATWATTSGAVGEHQIYALTTVPGSPGWLYAGTREGVLASRDGGATWALATAAHPEIVNVSSLSVDALQPRSVIAGTWRRAYKTDDDGATWRGIFAGMVEDTEVFSLNPVQWNPGELWASTCGWVYQTRDGGEHWARFQKGLDERRTPAFRVLADGGLLAGTVSGAYVSRDGGASWTRKTASDLSILSVAQSPAQPRRVLLGTEGGGVWLSEDGGETFTASSRGLQNVRVMALVKNGPEIVAGVNHAGPGSGVYSSFDRAASFSFAPAALPTLLDLVASSSGRIYAGTERGLYVRESGEWKSVSQVGAGRVEQVLANGKRLIARAPKDLFELHGKSFQPLTFKHGAPRSAALFDDALWVTDDAALYRLDGGGNHTIETPAPGGRLAHFGPELLLANGRGAWARRVGESAWREIANGATRVFETGDAAHPVLLVNGERAALWDAAAGRAQPLALPFPARDLAAALYDDGKLYLGTSGYGLLIGQPLPEPAPAP